MWNLKERRARKDLEKSKLEEAKALSIKKSEEEIIKSLIALREKLQSVIGFQEIGFITNAMVTLTNRFIDIQNKV